MRRKQDGSGRRTAAGAALALTLVCLAAARPSLAYFTSSAKAAGGQTLQLEPHTQIYERYEDWTKYLTIRNTGNARCWVRADVTAPAGLPLSIGSADGRWKADAQDPCRWYFTEPLAAGEAAPELTVAIGPVPQGWEQDFDVLVTGSCAPVLLDENGQPYACDSAEVWAQGLKLHTKGGA